MTRRQREWQVTWRRAAWSAAAWPKRRTFGRRAEAEAFIAKLKTGRRGLSPLTEVRLRWRWCGPWRDDE